MKHYQTPAVTAVKLNDPYLAPRQNIGYKATIPGSVAKCHETGRFEAFKLNWKEGMPNKPHIFWDSDVAKVLEGMAYASAQHPEDKALAQELDGYVDLVVSAQQPDGYLNVFFTAIEPENRWKNLFSCHELYCAGHLMEAAVAHWNATSSRKFLDAMCRYADYIDSVFGRENGKLRGYPGHEEIELALCKLAQATGNGKYYRLARYFVDERGQSPNYFAEESRRNRNQELPEYKLEAAQAHIPVREQTEAVGHAVRAVYLYTGMADVAAHFDDNGLLEAVKRLYWNIVQKKMYLTGGIGSNPSSESFTPAWNLPNDTAYAESCASMGLVQLSLRLLNITGDGRYADILEQVLYNNALSGLGMDGLRYFYANMQEADDNSFIHGTNQCERQPWFGCSCCPTSYCRFLPQLGTFCWSRDGAREYRLNIPASGCADFGTAAFEVGGSWPNSGRIPIKVVRGGPFILSVRIPGWCRNCSLLLNGTPVTASPSDGYISIEREWHPGDILQLDLPLHVDIVRANSKVTSDAGRVALMRGPVVYAFESVDNGNLLPRLALYTDRPFTECTIDDFPGITALRGSARLYDEPAADALYCRGGGRPAFRDTEVTAIPYALWQNRGKSSMAIWMREA